MKSENIIKIIRVNNCHYEKPNTHTVTYLLDCLKQDGFILTDESADGFYETYSSEKYSDETLSTLFYVDNDSWTLNYDLIGKKNLNVNLPKERKRVRVLANSNLIEEKEVIPKPQEQSTVNIELHNKLAALAEMRSTLEPILLWSNVLINPLLENSEQIVFILKEFKIPFLLLEWYKKEFKDAPTEVNVTFGSITDLKLVYFMINVLKEIYGDRLFIYFHYLSDVRDGVRDDILIGSYTTKDEEIINLSRAVNVLEILKLDILNINWDDIFLRFKPRRAIQRQDDNLDNLDNGDNQYDSSTKKYGGYNGWSDDVIDDAFEGDPMNTWNVD